MRFRKTYVFLCIFLVSVVGLSIVQYQYLRIGLNLAKVQFDRKVVLAGEEIERELYYENQLTYLIATAVNEKERFNLSMTQVKDASRHYMNDFIKQKLLENGVETDFSYRLYAKDSTDYLYAPVPFQKDESLIKYPVELHGYLPGEIGKPVFLEIQFKNLNQYFLSQLNGLTIPGLLFIIGLISVVIWILRSFYWQRNIITLTNDFINNLAHELKTPVFSIGLASKIIEADQIPGQKPIIAQIRQQVQRLNKHIEQVLELGSLESGRKIFTFEEADLYPILESVCQDFKNLAAMEKFVFSFELEPGHYLFDAEVSHFENALNNLLDNAKKYADQPEIYLKLTRAGRTGIITIRDNGIGISRNELRNIFKKFYRIPRGNLHKVTGHGLGLTYVRQVVRMHHAKLQILSTEGSGTTVTIKIPLKNG